MSVTVCVLLFESICVVLVLVLNDLLRPCLYFCFIVESRLIAVAAVTVLSDSCWCAFTFVFLTVFPVCWLRASSSSSATFAAQF